MKPCFAQNQKKPCFNSLQTGNHIQSESDPSTYKYLLSRFQFPSNGKSYPKVVCGIPQQILNDDDSFNSLQTGNHIQRCISNRCICHPCDQFQFPSNGKSYPKITETELQEMIEKLVSIPFKREIISKESYWHHDPVETYEGFNSLQTGNHIQRHIDVVNQATADRFQFPSNGKSYPKSNIEEWASIEDGKFQFPSNGKSYPKEGSDPRWHVLPRPRFNSLQTGNHIQRYRHQQKGRHTTSVSIPFKREIISKVSIRSKGVEMKESFNSLQTGNHIQRELSQICRRPTQKFQFPSNGKSYPKEFHNHIRLTSVYREFQFPSNGKSYPKATLDFQTIHTL